MSERLDIPALRQLCERATAGPWLEGQDGNARVYGPDGCGEDSGLLAAVYKGRANVRFIVAAREALPAALDEIERLRELIETAPHDHDCAETYDWPCNCWRSRAALNPEAPQ